MPAREWVVSSSKGLLTELTMSIATQNGSSAVQNRLPAKLIYHVRCALPGCLPTTCAVRLAKAVVPAIPIGFAGQPHHLWVFRTDFGEAVLRTPRF